ncbi:hypothetical protein [Candidatus Kuenenia stuttgartiensis]|uniref:hypothetical protein n=1 Tax=Kuenenia stuttgartiensis TaxID=174633 RepID=UPI00146F4E20|nr:hypothetical protein [Candidatus Kuenenia stuttgartiensis]
MFFQKSKLLQKIRNAPYGTNICSGTNISHSTCIFVSCFLGLNSKVSLPALALRSIIIAGITGIISHFFLKYILSVFTTDTQKEDTEDAPEQSQINEAETDGNRGKNGGMGR